MIASSKMGADAAVMANRAVRRLAGYAKILTVGQVAFYASDQFANALVGPLTWSIRGSGQPPTLGQWTPTCSDLAKDSNALYRNLALQDQFTDTSKELWQFDGWESAAGTAVKPLTTCGTDYRGQLAAYLPTSWGDPKAAQVVADQIGGAALTATDDPRVLVVTPFFPDGRIRLPLDPATSPAPRSTTAGRHPLPKAPGSTDAGRSRTTCPPAGRR